MFVEVNGTRLYVDVEGAGLVPDGPRMREKPTLILLHGGPGFDHTLFKPDFSALADVAQLVYVDHRGNGRSAGSDPSTWTLAQWGDDVKGLCDALGIEKPIVCGVSFGGFVAQSYATRHLEHPGKLILISTAARIDYPQVFDAFGALGGPEARAVAEAYWMEPTMERRQAFIDRCVPLYNGQAAVVDDWRQRSIVRHEVGLAFNGPKNEHGRMDFRAALAVVTCPVLVMSGDRDPITPIAFGETVAASLVNAPVRFERFPGAGHPVQADAPERALGLIREFILAG